ncbi:transposable element Tcb1 transposase [Trichonephila clavipes]|nr:transposable element Tcb1 transposase [Trichonephila clavipes]
MSFTRGPSSGRPRKISRREYRHIVRDTCIQPTASAATIQYHARGNWTAAEWNQVFFSDESRFNLSSDDNPLCVWKPRGLRLNPAFALERHATPTTGVMVWDVIADNTRSPLALICGTMTAQRYAHDILQPQVLSLLQRPPGAIFQLNAGPQAVRDKPFTRLSPYCYYPSLACPIPRFVSNRAYLGSFWMASWASHKFERSRGKVTANMERNVSRYHTELVCLNARSHRIVHSR